MRSILILSGCFVLIVLGACAKKDRNNSGDGPGLPGSLLYDFAGKVYKMDCKTGTRSLYFAYNTYSFISWDLSTDLQYGLTTEREPGNYTTTTFKLLNSSDRQILKQFEYKPPAGNNQNHSGRLSPDNSKILIQPDFENGIVIIDTNGEIIHHLQGINGSRFTLGDRVIWLPDNSILFTFQDKYIFKSSPPFSSPTLVKQMDYERWGNCNTNRDGTKISLFINNHIFLMDIDGKNLAQVTDSDHAENMALFSPDGRYLLVGSDYIHAPLSGSKWKLKIIPNDGKKYHLDNDPEVIPVKPANDNIEAYVTGKSVWIP